MLKYYHLSEDSGLEVILQSSTPLAPGFCLPRVPVDCPENEDQTTCRVCVAPSVWQCLLAIGRTGKFFIYQLPTSTVTELVSPPHKDSDFENTGEKWVTDKVVILAGGRVDLLPSGFIEYTEEMDCRIRKVVGCPVSADAGSDRSFFEIRDDEWKLRHRA